MKVSISNRPHTKSYLVCHTSGVICSSVNLLDILYVPLCGFKAYYVGPKVTHRGIHKPRFLSILTPSPSCTILLNKAYVVKWSSLNCPHGLWEPFIVRKGLSYFGCHY